MTRRHWAWVGTGIAGISSVAACQALSGATASDVTSERSSAVRVEYNAGGNAMRAVVNWQTPTGTKTHTGEMPLMNTRGTEGVSYDVPAGMPLSITVTNLGSQGSTNLGFAGNISCLIKVDGMSVSYETAKGFSESVTCSATADYNTFSK